MRTVIYTQRVEIIESYNERRDCADQRIADYINKCGFLPIPVPNKAAIAVELVDSLNPVGIILTGGNSLVKYGGAAPERDEMDKELIRLAIERNIPLYGFCRGMQSILNYFNNDLVEVKGHVAVRHDVRGIINRNVNTYHNQACIKLNEQSGLECIAKTEDGIIEAVKHTIYPTLATMWHPERETPYTIEDIEMVKKLLEKEI